jgi:leucyl-tRNA synthetase
MDPNNPDRFASVDEVNYWGQIDVYMGGAEHGTGHLLYVRFWTKVLYDLGLIPFDEPAKRLINQGMILGMSSFADFLAGKTRLNPNGGLETTPNFVYSTSLNPADRLAKTLQKWKELNQEEVDQINTISDINVSERRIDVQFLTPDGKHAKNWEQTKAWIKKYYDQKESSTIFPR